MANREDKKERVTRLILVEYSHHSKHGQSKSYYMCVCGKTKIIDDYSVRILATISCGCAKKKHGYSKSPSYVSWNAMIQRCTNLNNPSHKNYRGRGVKVHNRWRKFENFLEDMGERPSGTSIDRINNNGDYEPGNCRWSTQREQTSNTRRSRRLTFKGETMTVTQWAEKLNIHSQTLFSRLRRGWSTKETLTKPLHG